MHLIIGLIVFIMSGCTMFATQDILFPGLENEIQTELLDVTTNVVGPLDIYSECIDAGLNPVVAVLGAPLFGCAELKHSEIEGRFECSIYMAFDAEWIYEHEYRHCLGYMD